jgi:hypothetical protein
MQVIRTFWGNLNDRYKKEIINSQKTFKLNEYVYVWGRDNFNFIKSLGLQCKLVSENPYEFGNDFLKNSDTFYFHKLYALKFGCEEFGEVLFLDWDTIQIKELTSNFYKLLREKKSKIQMPLYVYPKNYKELVLKEWLDITDSQKLFLDKQLKDLKKHHYILKDTWVTPNAGFIYCNDSTVIDEIIDLCIINQVQTSSEEMGMVLWTKQFTEDLSGYIEKFEPNVCSVNIARFNQSELDARIKTQIKRDIFFTHI